MLIPKIFTIIALIPWTLAIPFLQSGETSSIHRRDGSGSVTSTAGLSWYDADLTHGTAGRSNISAYTCYSGPASKFPAISTWINFNAMWSLMKQYALTPIGDSTSEQTYIYNAIINISQTAQVDARVILATIILESTGAVNVTCTTSYGGIPNCGLMQSYNGTSFNASKPQTSITQMVRDGTQGTTYGPGLVQYFNDAADTPKQTGGNVYAVMRSYNSGKVNASDLSDGEGANPAYVSDIANYLQGWNGYGDGPASCGFPANSPTPSPSAATCATSAYLPAPTQTVAGTTSNCCTWASVAAGDSCYTIDTAAGITLAQFRAWNTYINAACDNLWANYAYCVNSNDPITSASASSSSSATTLKSSTSSARTSTSSSRASTVTKASSSSSKSTTSASKAASSSTKAATSTTKAATSSTKAATSTTKATTTTRRSTTTTTKASTSTAKTTARSSSATA